MLKGGTRGLSGELQEQKRGAQGTTKEGAETSMWHRQGHDNLQHDNSCRTIAEAADEKVVVRGRAWSCNTCCVCVFAMLMLCTAKEQLEEAM